MRYMSYDVTGENASLNRQTLETSAIFIRHVFKSILDLFASLLISYRNRFYIFWIWMMNLISSWQFWLEDIGKGKEEYIKSFHGLSSINSKRKRSSRLRGYSCLFGTFLRDLPPFSLIPSSSFVIIDDPCRSRDVLPRNSIRLQISRCVHATRHACMRARDACTNGAKEKWKYT